MTCDEELDDTPVAVTAAPEMPRPDAHTVDEPPADETAIGDEEAGYGHGV